MYAQVTESLEGTNNWCGITRNGMPGEAQTILLVEDEKFVREVTCEVLQSAGYRVLTAKTSLEASCLYEEYGAAVDLLLTDMILPGESGLALASRLRGENPSLNILLVSGYAMRAELRELQAEEVLAKPFSTETLLGRVRQLLKAGEFQWESSDSFGRARGAA